MDTHTVPIAQRRSNSWSTLFKAIQFAIVFDTGCILINASQFIFLLPLRILPFRWARNYYNSGIRYTKGAFGCLQILMCQWFAPTKLIVTFERHGMGAFTQQDIDQCIIKDANGNAVGLDLPTKFALVANHQIYADWWYAWCFTYFMSPHGIHRYVYITLKKSLQWVPIVGWAMQFFKFIFLARSWASDRQQLASALASLGREAQREGNPLCFMVYPEGTLVSPKTRPQSQKFADKMGIADMTNLLLPRSTGLHYSLRSLAPKIPGLKLLDLTMAYPGIPQFGYGQHYYTLRSIFFDGVPPPAIYLHIRMFDVIKDVPIGDITTPSGASTPDTPSRHIVDIPTNEKEAFDLWLRTLWADKDEDLNRYLNTGSFNSKTDSTPTMVIPLKLRNNSEILDAFCFFWPAAIAYLWRQLRGSRMGRAIKWWVAYATISI